MAVRSGRGPAPAQAEADGDRALPALVGRDDELAAVVEALGDPPALVLVEGEPGIGKTRLLREALAVPSLAERTVLVAACPPLEEPFPLGAVVDGVRRLRPDVAELNLSPLGGALRPLFPEWADGLPPALEVLDDPKETRHRVFAALTELVERLDVGILVVEDAHWADIATLEWLLAASGDPDLSIVVTYRPADVPDGSPLRRLMSHPPAGMRQLRVELEPLGIAETRRLVGSMFGTGDVSEEFAEFLQEHTDGIPLAVEECVRLLQDRRDIVQARGRWNRRILDELDVPPTVRDSVLERVERLDPDTRRVLEAAAVLAAPADEPLILAVAGVDGERAGRGAVAAALTSGLLQETDPGRFVFRHVFDSQAVGEAIPASDRRRLHRRAAKRLETMQPPPVTRLARHFREAGNTEAWCRYAEASADLALESGDDHTAVVILLDLLTSIDHEVDRRVRLALKLGDAAVFGSASLGALSRRVVEMLQAMLTGMRLTQPKRGELRLLLGRMLRLVGEEQAAFKEIEAAIPDLGHRPDLAIRGMTILAAPLVTDWTANRHRMWLKRASALLPHVESRVDRLAFTVNQITALLLLGEESGWRAAEALPHSAKSPREQRLIALGHLNLAELAVQWGRHTDGRQWLAAATEVIDATGYQRWIESVRVIDAYLCWYSGAWIGLDETVTELAEASETHPPARLEARQLLGLLNLARGARGEAERHLRQVFDDYSRLGAVEYIAVPAAGLSRLYLSDGAYDMVLRVTDPVIAMIAHKGVWHWACDIAPLRMAALICTGRLADAEDMATKFAGGVAGRGAPAPAAASVLCQGMLAEAKGELGRAASHFADAASAWAAIPRPHDELLALERRGRCLLAASDQEQGLALLSDVQQRLSDLGAKWDADRVAHILRKHGVEVVRTWRRGPRGYGDQLSPRELQVVELVARGMTNKQAAEVLFVSPKTVATQLSAAMRKLGASSRTAVAMAAAEAGLLSSDDSQGNDSQEKG